MFGKPVCFIAFFAIMVSVKSQQQNFGECRSYTVLNTRDRSQNVPRGNVLKCDRYDITSKGWYRFSGDAGYAMPTSCVPEDRCGTHAPGWLQGSHPSAAEGAVTRTVCYSYSNNCCRWSNSIRVRNCGGFYVYELDSTPNCYYRYCGNGADIDDCASTPCYNGGTCRDGMNRYTCTCAVGYTGRRCETNINGCVSNPCYNGATCRDAVNGYTCTCAVKYTGRNCETRYGTIVSCEENYMQIDLDKRVFRDIDSRYLHLKSKHCRASVKGNTLTLNTSLDSCGTTHLQTEKTITYWNEVRMDRKSHEGSNGTGITRARNISLPFYCKYGREKSVSTSFSHRATYFVSEGSYGNFTFTMELFRNASYQTSYQYREYPVSVGNNEPLYVQYSVKSTMSELFVFAESCRATTTGNPNSWPQYNFVKRGCAVDNTMTYHYKVDRVQRFIINSFQFIGSHPVVFLHCQLMVCHRNSNNSRCSQGCRDSLRSRRDTPDLDGSVLYDLTPGPLIRGKNSEKGKQSGGQGKSSPLLIGVLATVGGLFILVSIVLSVIVRRNSRRNKIAAAHEQKGVPGDDAKVIT